MGKDLNDKDLNLNWQDLRSKCQALNRKHLSENDLHLNLQDLISNRYLNLQDPRSNLSKWERSKSKLASHKI